MASGLSSPASIVSIRRYPVKSMMGEELNASEITKLGLFGDRAYALVDSADGKVASAKNPKKWPNLFEFRAELTESPHAETDVPPVRITLPDGTIVHSDEANVHQVLSNALHREVTLRSLAKSRRPLVAAPVGAAGDQAEEYWPDIEGLEFRDTVTEFGLPEGTFFDYGILHVLTTATLDRLRMLYPQGRFEARRLRPNLVVQTAEAENAFVENDWIGKVLAIGDTVRLSITGLCPRCVMTTLPQDDLPRDSGILRTAAQHNHANVGVYASVLHGGQVRRGDAVRIE